MHIALLNYHSCNLTSTGFTGMPKFRYMITRTYLLRYRHDIAFKKLIAGITLLLFLSIGISILFQISTSGACHVKAFFMLMGSILFWLFMGGLITDFFSRKKITLNAIVLIGLGILLLNQLFIRYFVELAMQLSFGCGSFSHNWLSYFISNNLVVNMVCYAGFVGYVQQNIWKPIEQDVPLEKELAPSEKAIFKIEEKFRIYPESVLIKDGVTQFRVATDDIIYIEVESNCIFIYTTERKIVLYQSLKSFSESLDPAFFIRVHRSTCVNRKHIVKMRNLTSGDAIIEMKNRREIRVSRTYKKAFMTLLSST